MTQSFPKDMRIFNESRERVSIDQRIGQEPERGSDAAFTPAQYREIRSVPQNVTRRIDGFYRVFDCVSLSRHHF
jgi:hypothetical protein